MKETFGDRKYSIGDIVKGNKIISISKRGCSYTYVCIKCGRIGSIWAKRFGYRGCECSKQRRLVGICLHIGDIINGRTVMGYTHKGSEQTKVLLRCNACGLETEAFIGGAKKGGCYKCATKKRLKINKDAIVLGNKFVEKIGRLYIYECIYCYKKTKHSCSSSVRRCICQKDKRRRPEDLLNKQQPCTV